MSPGRPRVLLVYTTPIKPDAFFGFVLPPLGLERLAACLEPIADVRILDLRFEGNAWLESALAFQPDVIGVNVKTTMYATHSYRMADRLRARLPRTRLILGGLHASSVPEEASEHGDVVVIGDGEQAVVEIVQGRPLREINGICYREAGKPIRTAPRPLLENLDELPPPARHLRPAHYRYMAAKLIPMDLLETSRGCTQYCPFCSPAITHKGK
ncbi:MAG TPA: cobalamin-dependent protein, partial [Candidatus Ozemobacteraceae bacterium]|nr:cobalamin-dependent protein [Candidatus Ozemobacteraceae bacterium]